jgi:hypothetical protein
MIISGTDSLEVPTREKRPIFQAYVWEYPHKIWPKIWYSYVPAFKDPEITIEVSILLEIRASWISKP